MFPATEKLTKNLVKNILAKVYLTREQCFGKPDIDEIHITIYELTKKGKKRNKNCFATMKI
jgi:hypothetical protein